MRAQGFVAGAVTLALTTAAAVTDLRGGELDGFSIGHLPVAIDDRTSVSDFEYEWGDVAFSSRVWERPREGGGAEVVLQPLPELGLLHRTTLCGCCSRYVETGGGNPAGGPSLSKA